MHKDCGLEGLTFNMPSRVKSQFADECNLSLIIQRFLKTGQLPNIVQRQTLESDAGVSPDLFENLDLARRMTEQFEALPLEERNRYNNDPLNWLEVVSASRVTADDSAAVPADDSAAVPTADSAGVSVG